MYRRGPIYWVTFRVNGKKYRLSTRKTSREEAQEVADILKESIAGGKPPEEKLVEEESRTFKQLMEKYMAEHSAVNKTPSSYKRDKSLRDHLVGYFGDTPVAEITPRMVSEYKTRRRREGATPKTVNNELILAGHAFTLAIREWEWLVQNPVRRVAKEKVNNLVERWLTFEEEKKLLEHCPEWMKGILILGIETGLRQSELLDLKWVQVDFSRKTVAILDQKNKGKDTLPLNETALGVLKERVKVRKGEHVFCNRRGSRINARNLLRAFYSAVAKSKLKNLRWHDATRHTFATRLVRAGVDIYTVQKLGRWRSISMVMRYAHHSSESLRPGVEALDRIRPSPVTFGHITQKERGCATPQKAMQPLDLIGSGAWI
jgi:integrase